jgi:DNA replication and repair protein RecF
MHFSKIKLVGFRNLASQVVELGPGLNFLIGANGQGKTNFLEALLLLLQGQGFRATEPGSLLQFGASAARLRARMVTDRGDELIQADLGVGTRSISVNDKRLTTARLKQLHPCVIFSPESLSAIKEGPDLRRNLIDEAVELLLPQHIDSLRSFAHALKSRNRLLKRIRDDHHRSLRNSNHDLSLSSLNQIFLVQAAHVVLARLQVLRELQETFASVSGLITDRMLGDISVDYVISGVSALAWDEHQVYEALRRRAVELAASELAQGTSLVGPHKHDIRILISGNDSRFYASQGQQRALILALKIAQITVYQKQTGRWPILLLDDVMSELDERRRQHLTRFLAGLSSQTIMTSTDLTWSVGFNLQRNSIFQVVAGRVERLPHQESHPDMLEGSAER